MQGRSGSIFPSGGFKWKPGGGDMNAKLFRFPRPSGPVGDASQCQCFGEAGPGPIIVHKIDEHIGVFSEPWADGIAFAP